VEQDIGSEVRFFELKISSAPTKPFAAQVGRLALALDGSLTFTAEMDVAPVASADGAATELNQPITLGLSQLLSNDSDPDGDSLTILSVSVTSTNGGTVTLTASGITYSPVNGFTGLDQFSYTISDGRGGTATAQVTVFVSAGPLPPQNGLALSTAQTGLLVRFAGTPGQSYQIQRAAAITGPWATLTTTPAPIYGIIEYADQSPPAGMSFYRAVSP
jgi:hypothetical protein